MTFSYFEGLSGAEIVTLVHDKIYDARLAARGMPYPDAYAMLSGVAEQCLQMMEAWGEGCEERGKRVPNFRRTIGGDR